MKKLQKTTDGVNLSVGASSTTWSDIEWQKVEVNVYRLQMRIAKARRERRFNKVKALQWLLTHSLEAKLLAVKRVTSNQGAKTPGVDGELYQSDKRKMELALSLKQQGYKAQPLRRVYIPKRNGKRGLGIPTLYDRAMQALYLMAVEPVAEMQADPNSYGFRPYRSTADAAERCFKVLCNKHSVQWILEGDIHACFDSISHEWLLNNIPMEKRILKQWLKAGYIEKQALFPTNQGTAQGGSISPVAANLALDGLEEAVNLAVQKSKYKAHTVKFADDFVIMGASKEILENKVKPAVVKFLAERGLKLSLEKTKITHINEGFDFLGFNIRKYQGKLLIKPSKKGIQTFLRNIRQIFKTHKAIKASDLINMLNPKIRGWGNYYRHVVAKQVFEYIDDCIYRSLSQWTRRRHPNKNFAWIRKKYFHSRGFRNWIFFGGRKRKNGEEDIVELYKMARIPIRRHVKIRAEATPYDPAFTDYLVSRKPDKRNKLYYYWVSSVRNLIGNQHWIHH
jgi:RNA-directed DNA polymerase